MSVFVSVQLLELLPLPPTAKAKATDLEKLKLMFYVGAPIWINEAKGAQAVSVCLSVFIYLFLPASSLWWWWWRWSHHKNLPISCRLTEPYSLAGPGSYGMNINGFSDLEIWSLMLIRWYSHLIIIVIIIAFFLSKGPTREGLDINISSSVCFSCWSEWRWYAVLSIALIIAHLKN